MIRNFTVENWKSFVDPTSFTMVATAERLDGDTLSRVKRSRILPFSVIFGANASGKSALIEALAALRTAVCIEREGQELLEMRPNQGRGAQSPTNFELEFIVSDLDEDQRRDVIYVYELRAGKRRIHYEALSLVRSRTEEILFEREGETVEFFGDLADNSVASAIGSLIRDNQTVLGELGRRQNGPAHTSAAYEWFSDRLVIVSPDARYAWLSRRLIEDGEFAQQLTKAISIADSGIADIQFQEINPRRLPITQDALDEIVNDLRGRGEDAALFMSGQRDNYTLELAKDGETLIAKVLVSCHKGGGETTDFTLTMGEESDGTRRYLDLIPLVFMLTDPRGNHVFVVDELERSLHPLLTEKILNEIASTLDSSSRRQLIFSSHEAALLKRSPFRRDEVWLVGKDSQGISRLDRLSRFRDTGVRDGTAVMEMYMAGQLGGVPRL